jgi:hypothetical protein
MRPGLAVLPCASDVHTGHPPPDAVEQDPRSAARRVRLVRRVSNNQYFIVRQFEGMAHLFARGPR